LYEGSHQAPVLAFLVFHIKDTPHFVVKLHQTLAEQLILGIQVSIVRTVELIHTNAVIRHKAQGARHEDDGKTLRRKQIPPQPLLW
ncbi:MAG: hypothetical protein H8E10_14105, partial [Desulfobacterales bacterium]|nr:hypothetical protein [Desulfobacterales bacterium]